MTTRRRLLGTGVPAAIVLFGLADVTFGAPVRLEESDPIAVSLGYRQDARKVDAKKFPTFVAGRDCAGCQLFQGKPTDMTGACPAFGGKAVNAKGWCAAWAKKA